jgi:hypothetical protein
MLVNVSEPDLVHVEEATDLVEVVVPFGIFAWLVGCRGGAGISNWLVVAQDIANVDV